VQLSLWVATVKTILHRCHDFQQFLQLREEPLHERRAAFAEPQLSLPRLDRVVAAPDAVLTTLVLERDRSRARLRLRVSEEDGSLPISPSSDVKHCASAASAACGLLPHS
jgi:hypothetical protein